MSQNLITLSINADQRARIVTLVGQLEEEFKGLVFLTPEMRRAASKMGLKSEQFCRQTLHALMNNPHVVPPSIGVGDGAGDLDMLDQLRPIFGGLHQLSERAADSELALGSDAMVAALAGYRVLKAVGKAEGLETLRKELGGRFTKSPRQTAEPEAA
jgi:hypothetical protein